MSAERQMIPSEFPTEVLDRFLFALIGRAKLLTVTEKLMTREEAAAYIGYSPQHIDRLVKKGKIPAHRIEKGADPRFIPSELLEVIKRA